MLLSLLLPGVKRYQDVMIGGFIFIGGCMCVAMALCWNSPSWRAAWRDVRFAFAETLLGWALEIMPSGPECKALCSALAVYFGRVGVTR
jgi:hypothetical protein